MCGMLASLWMKHIDGRARLVVMMVAELRTLSRPGVAMTTCGRRANSRACCCMSTPPMITESCINTAWVQISAGPQHR